MERIVIKLTDELQNTYWDYLLARCNEYIEQSLTGRIVIDFQKGKINSVQNQQIVSGVSILGYEMNKYDILTRALDADNI